MFGWLLAILALAGPSWEKLPQPLMQKQDGLVILLDLSYSMYAEDIQPSRLIRARQKILDLLKNRKEGLTGMVSYAGDAHVVSPMTDDVATIANLIPALEPAMMPSFGSNPSAAVKTALELFKNSGLKRGRILLIGDAITDSDIDAINTLLNGSDFALSLLAIGTTQGAPIPFENGFVRNSDGNIVLPGLTQANFETLATKTGARFSELQLDDSDLKQLLAKTSSEDDELKSVERSSDQWRNRGPWLVMILLPIAALAFRRGWLIMLAVMILANKPTTAQALEWQDIWQSHDQQAAQQLANGDAAAAAERFDNPRWKANAFYQAGDYAKALETFSSAAISDDKKNADDFYNQGNMLARNGKLDEAIAAYNKALEKNSGDEDAKANKALLEKLKEQQKQQQDQQQNQNSQQQPQSGEQNQAQNNQQEKNQKEPNQTEKKQNNSDQQASSDQQNSQDPNFDDQAKQDQQNREQQLKEQKAQEKNTKEQQTKQENAQQAAESAKKDQQKPEKTEQQNNQQQATEAKQPTGEELQKQQQQQATEQWLRQIPDDPGGLMQRKFRYEYEQRRRQGETGSGNQQPW